MGPQASCLQVYLLAVCEKESVGPATVVGKDVCSGIEMQTINKLIIGVLQVLPLYKCHRQIRSGSSVLGWVLRIIPFIYHTCRGLKLWSPKLFANYHPSYYGMMVASFTQI